DRALRGGVGFSGRPRAAGPAGAGRLPAGHGRPDRADRRGGVMTRPAVPFPPSVCLLGVGGAGGLHSRLPEHVSVSGRAATIARGFVARHAGPFEPCPRRRPTTQRARPVTTPPRPSLMPDG